ncbi:TetR family transcriptional regulator [Loktanella sp. D2R18]|uniref:TetR/AcrR family transcriptional regulator n=1 Tax=Rhodobacterales TaxID=204455 RepID=UPI000DEBA4C8|nr:MULTISPECIES: TetR family transcriptional regulator [Rhodobacterales]MDO6590570.1 TetR family transcriptional regulator [Yoonia sp. 1_MG-2023]RBW41286.1 TetR family transcriptional regulator [Loktanella sp. D2R18]
MVQKERRVFQRETADARRQSLIEATLDVIGDLGFNGATVREITKRANVTQGLVRHHFTTKDQLLNAAYAYHMSQMTELSLHPELPKNATAVCHLATTVQASLTAPVMSERNLTLWASFLGKLRKEAYIRETHERTYLQFCDGLAVQIAEAWKEVGRLPDPDVCRELAISCNAMIDGLWIEGAALHSKFAPNEIANIGLRDIGVLLDLDLQSAIAG